MKNSYSVVLLASKKMQYHEFLTLKNICQSKEINIPAIIVDTTTHKISLKQGMGKAKKRTSKFRSLIILLTYIIKSIINGEKLWYVEGAQIERALTNNGNVLEFFGTKKSKKLVPISDLFQYYGGEYFYTNKIDDKDTIKKLKSLKPDLIFRCGFGIIPLSIIDIPKDGILSYHHGDLTKYRGGMPSVWEVYNKEKDVGVTIQKLNERIDAGDIVLQRFYEIKKGESINRLVDRIFLDSVDMGIEAILKIKKPGYKLQKPKKLGKYYGLPTTKEWVKLHCINISRKLGT